MPADQESFPAKSSSSRAAVPLTYFTTVLGDGTICPISAMLGRKRVRAIDARSAEGKKLLRNGQVTIQVSGGRRFSGLPIVEVFDRLVADVEEAADNPDTDPRAVDSLGRLCATLQERRAGYS